MKGKDGHCGTIRMEIAVQSHLARNKKENVEPQRRGLRCGTVEFNGKRLGSGTMYAFGQH